MSTSSYLLRVIDSHCFGVADLNSTILVHMGNTKHNSIDPL